MKLEKWVGLFRQPNAVAVVTHPSSRALRRGPPENEKCMVLDVVDYNVIVKRYSDQKGTSSSNSACFAAGLCAPACAGCAPWGLSPRN